MTEQGPNGEICFWFAAAERYEIWGWADVSEYQRVGEGFAIPINVNENSYTGDVLLLVTCFHAPGRNVQAMTFMNHPTNPLFASAFLQKENLIIEVRQRSQTPHTVDLGPVSGKVCLKASLEYLIVSTSVGFLHVLKRDGSKLLHLNVDGTLLSLHNHYTRPLNEKYKMSQKGTKHIVFKTAAMDSAPIFDIMGSWLVYCPTKAENDYFKNLLCSDDNVCAKSKNAKEKKGSYTSVKLPPNGPLLFRVASSVSSTAFDKLFKISQLGTTKVKSYMKPGNNFIEKDVSLQSISSSIGSAIFSTANKIKKQASLIGEHETVKIIDLSNGEVMATFKPPGGISFLSLSGYDLQLAQVNYKGDSIYLWDLYQLPNEISFVGKFLRGKTSAVVKEICWFVNNKIVDGTEVTNSGFGCITKETGSIHWYNINYLSCANGNDNYPNSIKNNFVKPTQFLDSWILPSVRAQKFFKLPAYANAEDDFSSGKGRTRCQLSRLNQLAFIDSEQNLRLMSPLNGKHIFKYRLGKTPAGPPQTASAGYNSGSWFPTLKDSKMIEARANIDTPLSQTEIETCGPFSAMVKDRKVKITHYDFGHEATPSESFWKCFVTFGNDIPVVTQDFGDAPGMDTPVTSSDDLLSLLGEGLVISPESEKLEDC